MRLYDAFLKTKIHAIESSGFDIDKNSINAKLFPFQRDIVIWALKRGRAAIFADCGLGKTAAQLEWARHVVEKTGGKVLILAPLAVGQQTVREGIKFGIPCSYVRNQSAVKGAGIYITNYEMMQHFDCDEYIGIVLDESGILKSFDGKTKTSIIESFRDTPYRLACTATPAPNDFMELGNHAEFLDVMTRSEMLAMFFVHDGGDTSKWRIKGHAKRIFWDWVCSWAVNLRKPSDLGYEDDGFILPELRKNYVTATSNAQAIEGQLFPMDANTLDERRKARKMSLPHRVEKAEQLIRASGKGEKWVVWCDYNAEQSALKYALKGQCVSIEGATPMDDRIDLEKTWREKDIKILITKPSVFGWGMNWQHCNNVIFCGLSDSYEQFYQAVRRCWRFGQNREVNCYVITSDYEAPVVKNILRKDKEAKLMADEMVKSMMTKSSVLIHNGEQHAPSMVPNGKQEGDGWTMHLGDCVDKTRQIETDSIHYSIFSPPFASLYTYSDSERDMGNCKTHTEFYEHFKFIVPELLRVTKPGRLLSFHCMNLPTSKTRDGVIGISDFRGILIKAFVDAGWIYHSEVCIWKDPVTAMQRTKALGLLHKQLKKDSCMCRQGIPDYLVTMRKPGDNTERVTHTNESFPVGVWQNYASPVWMDINPSETLQRLSAREHEDERHICPLQLEVIRRALRLWTNPNDVVYSPFAGIGSEGYIALEQGRRFIGVELKKVYFEQACGNLENMNSMKRIPSLFDQ